MNNMLIFVLTTIIMFFIMQSKSEIVSYTLLSLLFSIVYFFSIKRNKILTEKMSTKIFYNFDKDEGKYNSSIHYIGEENTKIVKKFVEKYSDFIYMKKNAYDSIFDIFKSETDNKIVEIQQDIENKKINESANKFKHCKEIKDFFIKNLMWEISDSELSYEIVESIKLDTNNTIDINNIEKYIYIDNGYYFDITNIKNYEYHLDFIVNNGGTCDLIIISSNKNKNIQDMKQNIKNLENTISELKKEISEIKNQQKQITIEDKAIADQQENEK